MKRVVLSVVLVIGLGLQSHAQEALSDTKVIANMLAAKENNDMDTVMITMTLNKFGSVKINLKGSGTITIDWGNGKIDNTQVPSSGVIVLSLTYWDKSNRTITIYGQHITYLNCRGNQITSLDVSNSLMLKSLQCSRNQLTKLDVSKNAALTLLSCDRNLLAGIDVSNNIDLTNMSCSRNQLKSLDVSKNNALTFLNCRKNQLSAEALNVLFGTLNSAIVEGKILYILNNPGTKTCNQKIATDREWKIDTSLI